MQSSSKPGSIRRIAGLGVAAILIVFAVAAVVKGLDGHATVSSALSQEKVVGTPDMTPAAIAAKAGQAGVQNLTAPACSVAGKQITSGADARCFAEYMRVDALIATGGKTYAQMPRFATKDHKGTNDPAGALTYPNGEPMNNPAREVWVTETAMSTALNTSYMAEQISLFGTAVGAVLGLLGLILGLYCAAGLQLPARAERVVRERVPEPSAA
jgi:hypothetical protein